MKNAKDKIRWIFVYWENQNYKNYNFGFLAKRTIYEHTKKQIKILSPDKYQNYKFYKFGFPQTQKMPQYKEVDFNDKRPKL